MRKLLIIDKDGTLVTPRDYPGSKFVQRPWDQQPITGITYQLNKLRSAYNWQIVIASNQGGVESKKKTLESAIMEMEYCLELFPAISFALFCPDYAGKLCYRVNRNGSNIKFDNVSIDPDDELAKFSGQYRKPNPGMLLLAKHLYQPDLCGYVGDRPEDEEAANAAGIPYKHIDKFLEIEPYKF